MILRIYPDLRLMVYRCLGFSVSFFFLLLLTLHFKILGVKRELLDPLNGTFPAGHHAPPAAPPTPSSHLATRRSSQDVVGVHGAQLVPAPVPARLTLDADDLVDALETVHADGVEVHQPTCGGGQPQPSA